MCRTTNSGPGARERPGIREQKPILASLGDWFALRLHPALEFLDDHIKAAHNGPGAVCARIVVSGIELESPLQMLFRFLELALPKQNFAKVGLDRRVVWVSIPTLWSGWCRLRRDRAVYVASAIAPNPA